MLVGRKLCHSRKKTSICRCSLKIIARAARCCDRAGFAANRQHCDWSASSGAVKYLPEKCASAQPKPNRSRARSEASSASANEGCTQKQAWQVVAIGRRTTERAERQQPARRRTAARGCSTLRYFDLVVHRTISPLRPDAPLVLVRRA